TRLSATRRGERRTPVGRQMDHVCQGAGAWHGACGHEGMENLGEVIEILRSWEGGEAEREAAYRGPEPSRRSRMRTLPTPRAVRVGAVAAGIALAATAAWAGQASDQVKASVDRVLKLVQDPDLKKPLNAEKRRAQIREVARGLFDFEEMGKRAL